MDTLPLLQKLVSIPSVYPNEAGVSAFIEEYLKALGFQVERVLTGHDRPNLVATLGLSDRYLGFYGHMDTVPPARGYTRQPFEVLVDGDTVYGLGVCDMKGGLTCILQAAAWAAKEQLPLKLVFGVDEEDISQGAHDLVHSGKLKDLGFLVVAESGQIEDFSQPISVCLGRKGRIVYEIDVHGKAAHAAEATKGVNAIELASRLIAEISKIALPGHPRLGTTSIVVQSISAESGAFSVPDKCRIGLSLLTTPGLLGSDFEALLSALAEHNSIPITIRRKERQTPYGDSYEIDLNDPFFKTVRRHVLEPLKVSPIYTPSVADENVFANNLDVAVMSVGVIGGGDHTAGEWAKLSSFDTVIETFKQIIIQWHKRSA
jgi:succinyl-diaminopimelate desuccinylase